MSFCKKAGFVVVMSVALAACGGGGGSDSPSNNSTVEVTPVKVLTVSGALHALSGSYDTGCAGKAAFDTSGKVYDTQASSTYSGTNYSSQKMYYASSNGTCTGGVIKTEKWIGVLTVNGSTAAISGWEDAALKTVPAPIANNGTSIGNSVAYTSLTETDNQYLIDGVASSVNTFGVAVTLPDPWDFILIVDDTAGGAVRIWENVCDVVDDAHCKAYPTNVEPMKKI